MLCGRRRTYGTFGAVEQFERRPSILNYSISCLYTKPEDLFAEEALFMQLDTSINAVGRWGHAGSGKASWISPDADGWRGGDGREGTVKPPRCAARRTGV
jgi:hypothetical protein